MSSKRHPAQVQASRPVQRVQASGYGNAGASYGRKSLSSWRVQGTAPDDDIVRNLRTLRARSRDLYMGNPLASGAVKTIRTNVVGSGLMLHAHVDRSVLGLSEEQAEAWEHKTEREWHMFSDSASCDAQRMQTFYQLQSLVLISALISGDVFVALPFIRTGQDPYQLKIEVIEGDRVCNPDLGTALNLNADILEGVEVGKYGEPVAYYVAKYHPGLSVTFAHGLQEWKRIPAFGARSGRRNLLHIMDLERPGQRRGVPLFSPVLEALKQLGRYTDSELMAALVASYFTVFIKHNTPDHMPGMAGVTDSAQAAQEAADAIDGLALTNGGIVDLPMDTDIQIANPARPATQFNDFVISICRQVGAALEIPYELLVKNFTASYSASRGSLLEAWKMFRMRRQWLVDQFCQPVYEEWLAEAVALGRIDAPGFFTDPAIRRAWCMSDWSGDTQGQLDPRAEVQAAVDRINNCLSTREHEAAELTGMSFEAIAAQLAKEQAIMSNLGIKTEQAAPALAEELNNGQDHNQPDPVPGESGR